MQGVEMRASYVGNEALAKRGVLNVHRPIEHGTVTDWNSMEMIWEHTFNQQLRLEPSLHPVLLIEGPLSPKSGKERALEIMFESFHSPAVYMQQTACLALYASGRTTGLVLESGDGVTHAVPVYEGFAVRKTVLRMDVSGHDMTQVLQRQLKAEGLQLESSAELEIVRDIKEKLCYVALDYESECQKPIQDVQADYTLPDGSIITVGQARFEAAEAIFDPRRMLEMEDEYGGICGMATRSINASEIDLRGSLARNVVLVRAVPLNRDSHGKLKQGKEGANHHSL